MYKTIEAIYDNGKIIPIENEELDIKKGKILITVIEEEEEEGISGEELSDYQGVLSNFKENPVSYQRKIRDEW
jgi:predicted DNA-binding antitoxin AbrB/MazE fold protein